MKIILTIWPIILLLLGMVFFAIAVFDCIDATQKKQDIPRQVIAAQGRVIENNLR